MSDVPTLESPLLYFLAVVEHGSFSAAARAIHVSQPSISVAVRRLEERMQATLLHRDTRGASATPAGELLATRVRECLATLKAARDEIHALEGEPRGRYRLGLHESLGAYFLPGFMGQFIGRHPDIELDLLNAGSREVEAAVIERSVDVGLVVNPTRHPDCVVQGLFDDVVALVVSPKLRKSFDNVEALLAGAPLLHVPQIAQTQAVLNGLGREGVSAPKRVTCSSMELVKNLVLDGTGVGILPWRVAVHGVSKGRIERVSGNLPHYRDHIALVRRADIPVTAALRLLLDALLERGRAMGPLPDES